MKKRDELELALSTLIDHELERDALLPTIDRLVDDEELREFWREARALDAFALEATSVDSPEASAAAMSKIWNRIEGGAPSSQATATAEVARRQPVWKMAAAAGIVLAALAGFWFGTAQSPEISSLADNGVGFSEDGFIEVVVGGEQAGGMNDRRFVEMTVELLSSDPRYHRKMQEILGVVVEEGPMEGSRERWLDLDRGDRRDSPLLEAADSLGAETGPML